MREAKARGLVHCGRRRWTGLGAGHRHTSCSVRIEYASTGQSKKYSGGGKVPL